MIFQEKRHRAKRADVDPDVAESRFDADNPCMATPSPDSPAKKAKQGLTLTLYIPLAILLIVLILASLAFIVPIIERAR
jgi:hypothetical protein